MAVALVGFVGDVFRDPLPPVTKLEQAKAKDERRRKLVAYCCVAAAVFAWGGLGLIWIRDSESCAHTSHSIYRLALLLVFVYLLLLALVLLFGLALAVDYCLSGKLRFVVILEQD